MRKLNFEAVHLGCQSIQPVGEIDQINSNPTCMNRFFRVTGA